MQHRFSVTTSAATTSYRRRLGWYLEQSSYRDLVGKPGVVDLAFGDPHEYPSSATVDLLRRSLVPRDENWFAYVRDDVAAQEHIAGRLSADLGVPFEPDDVFLTAGAFAGLATALRTVCQNDDEVVYLNPAWFYYEPMIVANGATPKPVDLPAGDWHLDLDAIAAAITRRTCAVILNSPNNPTGVIYGEAELRALADLLASASRRHGRPIYLISDEAYRRIVLDDVDVPSPARFYPYTIVVHTYTKTLLLPGERIGYLAIPATMPAAAEMREALGTARLVGGWHCPSNSLQYAVPHLDGHRIPLEPLRRRRDLMVEALRGAGYRLEPNAGTFYLLAETPTADDWSHARLLEKHDLLVLPASTMGASGYVRISLTVTDEMTETFVERLAAAYPVPVESLS